jgi:hypothetical protein
VADVVDTSQFLAQACGTPGWCLTEKKHGRCLACGGEVDLREPWQHRESHVRAVGLDAIDAFMSLLSLGIGISEATREVFGYEVLDRAARHAFWREHFDASHRF